MCGIFGYIGNKQAAPLIINGLKRLEYRGYDSWGLCLLNREGLASHKSRGKISEVKKNRESAEWTGAKGQIGIGHTRWATHGKPSIRNAHPHFDCQKEIAVVHNGIIENYQSLRALLEKEGHIFSSQTDTEVIAHLIEKFYQSSFEWAVTKALKLLEGTFGLAMLCRKEERIIAARKGSPLVLGVGKEEMFVASDSAAVLPQTRKIVYLDDDEIAVVKKNSFSVRNFDGKSKIKEIQELKIDITEIEKRGFKHFMLKEIFEQPKAVENTLRGRVGEGKIKLSLDIFPAEIKKIIITACGTSYYAGLAGKYIIEQLARIPVEVDYASEFRYRNPILDKNDLMVVISQSGETADTLAALRLAKERDIQTLGVVNVVGSAISREVDCGVFLHAGPEIGVASTKAFTSQLAALILFALFLQQTKGTLPEKEILNELSQIPDRIETVLKKASRIKEIAQEFKQSSNFLYLGRGFNFPVALEGALKLKEISYIHAEGYPAAEMKHGPIALIDENMPVVFLATKDKTYEKILNNMEEVKARKGKILAVINKGDGKVSRLADYILEVPEAIDIVSPIVNVIPLQLLAYYIADSKGINPDKPRNLAKAVTVE